MKNIKITSFFLVLFSVFALVSCSNEPVDPALANALATNFGGGNSGGGGSSGGGSSSGGGGTSTGDYWPTALNNQWVFSQNGTTQSPMKMISIDNIGGNTYYTFNPQSGFGTSSTGSATQRLRKNSGDYYMKIEDLNINFSGFTGVQTGYEFIFLKDYLSVGGTWSGSYTQTTTYNDPSIPVIAMNTNYSVTILEVGSSVTVGSTTYSNVIKTRLHTSTAMSGLPTTDVYTDYWFSKNVGPVKFITYSSGGSTTPQYTSLLTSFTLN